MSTEKTVILIVDDDDELRALLADFLTENFYTAIQAKNTQEAEQLIKKHNPELMLLDLMMPGEDGAAFCRRIRDNFNKPIIMLTAVKDEIEQIVAHEVGVDDYLIKPYNHRILLAKIKSLLRRYNAIKHTDEHEGIIEEHSKYQFNNWVLNLNTRSLVTQDDVLIALSSAEYNLLLAFLQHPNRVLTRDQLIDYSKSDSTEIFDRSIDVLISRLRSKLKDTTKPPNIIVTVRGDGYMFGPKVSKC